MKNLIFVTILVAMFSISSFAESIEIKKANTNDPLDVCHNKEYNYSAILSDLVNGTYYEVDWIPITGSVVSGGLTTSIIKWSATTSSFTGKLTAKLYKKVNNVRTLLDTSNEITVTIKSILHLEPNLTPYTNGTTALISPCSAGQVSLEVTKLEIPGTGIFPEKIYNYMWTLPAGWSANGITSTGSNEIPGGSYITAAYPASSTSGTIKVKGYEAIIGCDDATPQSSK